MTSKPTSPALNISLELGQDRFTCLELSSIGLPGLPSSEQGWGKLVARESWEFVEVPAKGGKRGTKREYFPPPELFELMRRHLRGEVVTEDEVRRARTIRKAPSGRGAFHQTPGRGRRAPAATAVDADQSNPVSAAPPPASGAGAAAAGARSEAATASEARSDTAWITDPTDEDRLQMLLVLLRTMEHRLKAPVSAEVAARMLEVVESWHDFAARQPEILARLEAVRSAANLYLAR